jgi:hypothetical protein
VAWQRYEEADAERHCKEADAEGIARQRRTVLVSREGGAVSERGKKLRSWGVMASEISNLTFGLGCGLRKA